jgi:hypothetical protein
MPSLRTNLVALVLVGLASAAVAEPPEDLPRLRQYSRSSIFRFGILDGNLVLRCQRPVSFQISSDSGGGQKENLSARIDRGQTVLNYQRVSAKEDVKVVVGGAGSKVSITRSPRGAAKFTAMEFQQTPGQGTTLTLGSGRDRQVFRAADLWRLAIAQPKLCQEHLFPLLDMLRQDRKLAPVAARIEETLLARASADPGTNDARWAAMVKQLGDDQFAKREAADRALRAGGASSLAYLRQVDFNHLDAEQQFRIRRILAAYSGRSDEDSADEVAATLAADRDVWLALLGRPELETRRTAARQLAKLLGRAIDVDPAADPDSQKANREKLRAVIEKK